MSLERRLVPRGKQLGAVPVLEGGAEEEEEEDEEVEEVGDEEVD